ncbi:MAG: hypothetical protein AVDCRST_MAG19-1998, partial [uncultured Thermomicrobiales bacterium]
GAPTARRARRNRPPGRRPEGNDRPPRQRHASPLLRRRRARHRPGHADRPDRGGHPPGRRGAGNLRV